MARKTGLIAILSFVLPVVVAVVGWVFLAGAKTEKIESHTKQLENHEQRIGELEKMAPDVKAIRAWTEKHP